MPSNTPSLNKLIEIIGLVSRNHRMVKDFRFGPLWDMNALKDLQTPYIWCEEAQSRITMGNNSHKTGLYTFRLYCMDRIQKDQSNYNEILSDTKFILDTIMTEIDQHPLFIQLGLSIDEGDIVFEPVYEETDINANGHSVEFTLRFPIRYTPCNVPIDPLAGFTFSLNNNVFQYSVQGVPGPTGSQGSTGPQGFQGATGPQGETGSQGDIGATGPQGDFGPQGDIGATGLQGETGPQGNTGPQGEQGVQGNTGPQGSDGISVSYYRYNARTNTQSPPPSNSQIIWDNATQINSTILYIDHITSDNIDIDVFLALIKTGDNIIIQDANDSTAYQKWVVSGTISQTLVYTTLPVTYVEGGHQYTNGENIIFIPLSIGISGPQGVQGFRGNTGPQGFTGPQGATGVGTQGPTGPQGFQGITGPQGPVSSSTLGGVYIMNTTETSATGTAELINKTLLIPANSFTASNAFNITVRIRKDNSGFNQTTTRIYIGATNSTITGAFSFAGFLFPAVSNLTGCMIQRSALIISATNSTSYILPVGSTASTSAQTDFVTGNAITSAIDWTQNQYVIVTTQTNNAGYSAFIRSIQISPQ